MCNILARKTNPVNPLIREPVSHMYSWHETLAQGWLNIVSSESALKQQVNWELLPTK